MSEFLIQQFLPQIAKILAFLIIFISSYTVINLKGGIPTKGNKIKSKIESLIIICIVGGILLLIVEPFLETIILSFLYRYVKFAIPIVILVGGIAILKFNQNMTWDYSKYGYGLLIFGILLIVFILYF